MIGSYGLLQARAATQRERGEREPRGLADLVVGERAGSEVQGYRKERER